MDEIVKIALDNEMDLIVAHKRSMKLAEMAGLTLSAQTSFATAVSEVARTAIETGKRSFLHLGVESGKKDKYIVATISNPEAGETFWKGLEYARRLVDKYQVSSQNEGTDIELFYATPLLKTDLQKLNEWRIHFRNEPSVSPYEEIKRKIDQLQELSDKLQKSESQYKTLTNALPLIIFALDTDGRLLYANEWLQKYTGETHETLNQSAWETIVHPEDYEAFHRLLGNAPAATGSVQTQARLRHKSRNDYFWHQAFITPFQNEQSELQYWIGYIVDIHAQKVYEETLKDNAALKAAQKQLEENQKTLENYIAELNRSNQELQQFAFVASHDLQEPVRKLLFYSDYLISQYLDLVDEKGASFLRSMQASAQRMRNLIQDLLVFSQINRKQVDFTEVDLNSIAKEALQDLEIAIEEKQAVIEVAPLPVIRGDARMMRQLFENILGNSLKYASSKRTPVIKVSCERKEGFCEIAFRDNGIGFDEKYLPQMFTLFQRLHSRQQYEGTGLGLAICLKIVEMHGGKIRAESKEGEGACFFVSLPGAIDPTSNYAKMENTAG